MMAWPRVKWSAAGQITQILQWRDSAAAAEPPQQFLESLKLAGRYAECVMFLGQALPRYEVVAWAARFVRDTAQAAPASAEANALKAALLWVQDPGESRRRAAFDAAQSADPGRPETLAALAAYFSGGSVAPPDCEPLPAPPDTAGRFAAGAILVAAARSADEEPALKNAIAAGEALAAGEAV